MVFVGPSCSLLTKRTANKWGRASPAGRRVRPLICAIGLPPAPRIAGREEPQTQHRQFHLRLTVRQTTSRDSGIGTARILLPGSRSPGRQIFTTACSSLFLAVQSKHPSARDTPWFMTTLVRPRLTNTTPKALTE